MPKSEELIMNEDILDNYKALDALKESKGGKVLVAFSQNAIDIEVNWLVNNYKTADEIEMRARIANIASAQNNISMIANAKDNAEVTEEQIKSLKE